ncbi:MAG: ABC transporter permease [Acidobacteriia bacterium]|nr:ABC transporter permease [Terriglobia bacterium]
MGKLWRKLLFGIRRSRFDRDLEDEMRVHLEMKAEAGGGTEDDRYTAKRQFGNTLLLRETSRDMWGWVRLETLLQDLRYGARMLRKNPGFTTAAVLSLALGIGANTAIFSLVNAVLLRPLPYRDAGRLAAVWEWNIREAHINTVTAADFADWRARNHVFEDMGYSWDEVYTFTGATNPEAVAGYMFSCNIFPMLGAKPFLGRTFLTEECQPGKDHVVVLSYPLWQRRFGSDRQVIGRSIQLNHQLYTVAGVMPPEFAHPSSRTVLWTPLALPPDFFSDRKDHALRVFGRLKAGISFRRAEAEMDAIAKQLAREYPDNDAGMGVELWPIRDFYVGDRKTSLVLLQTTVLGMLLIACVNVANLLLARGSAREREVALRLALGAGSARLFRQFLTEGLVLAMLGGTAGLALAFWGVGALTSLIPGNLTDVVDTSHPQAWINMPVLLFTLLLSLVSGAVFGTTPAFRSSASPNDTLKAGGRTFTEARGKARLRSGLVVSQMALSLVLLIAAGLLIRSFLRLQARDYGFRTEHVLTLQLMGGSSGADGHAAMGKLLQSAIERIEVLPGVVAAGAINAPPLTGWSAQRNFTIPGQPPLPFGEQSTAGFHVVTPHYFRAMGIHLSRGRYFDTRDRDGGPGVIIVNETLARRFFPNQDAIGKGISVADGDTPAIREIVGVVGDTRHEQLADAPDPEIYRPFGQADWPFAGIAVRTSGDPTALAAAVRSAIWSVSKEQPIDSVMTLEERAAASLAPRRANVILLSLFAGIALLLAAVGIYGVIAYSVSRRTQEMGIRMALGARGRQVTGMVLGRALLLALVGVVIGLFAAVGATRFMGSLLVDISPTDGATFIFVPLLLCVVAAAAAYLPARRAGRVDPMVALRYE